MITIAITTRSGAAVSRDVDQATADTIVSAITAGGLIELPAQITNETHLSENRSKIRREWLHADAVESFSITERRSEPRP